ncbi:hypothetical protein UCDDS831_g07739 [Diplodia seriata]|uniref:Uncharacterized protein n=1 Tax=Diplodia seriata TaxID=420778 RepID=A0A0G2DXD8_9PEZI|nr:hypothetical protein UCDDS831_g07739 [Diplodia seriata]
MSDMSDNEADTIVVAMAAPNGPLGDAFEVSNAAGGSRINSHAKTPRKQKPAARRKPSTKSPSVAPHKSKSTRSTGSPAPAAKLKRTTNHARNDSSGDSVPYSPSPSPVTTTNTSNSTTGTPTGTPTNSQICANSSIANAATIARLQNTRVVRFKKQLCTQWDIDQADLNAVFNSATIVDGPSEGMRGIEEKDGE